MTVSTAGVDAEVIGRLCRSATARSGSGAVLDVTVDPLDGSAWVRLSSWPRSREALDALQAHGLDSREAGECRLQVIGWDPRLLHRRLAIVLAGVDDLTAEWDATKELALYHWDRRAGRGEIPDPVEVLADVERVMRASVPLPHTAPLVDDVSRMLTLIDSAEDAFQRLIAQHLDLAEQIIEACSAAAQSARDRGVR